MGAGIIGLADERNLVERYNVTTPPINAKITNKIKREKAGREWSYQITRLVQKH